MTDARDIAGVYAIWVNPDDVTSRWIDESLVPRARVAPGVLGVEHLATPDGSELVLAWTSDPDESSRLDELRYELASRAGGIDGDSGMYRRRTFVGSADMAPGVLAVRLRVLPGSEQNARDWLDGEHSVRQLTVDGAVNFQGFEPVSGSQPFFNVWGVREIGVVESDAWVSMRATPWRDRFWPEVLGAEPGQYVRAEDPLAV